MPREMLGFLVMAVLAAPVLAAPPTRSETDKKVDEAIRRGLSFLKNTQNQDGSWTAGRGKHPAITALAVMAFLSAGHVPGEGPYAETVEKGIKAVLSMQNANGLIATELGHEMYHHGICTLMLAEAIGMTKDPLAREIKERLEKAVKIILVAQRKVNNANKGGWRYRVAGYDADMSVTGWQLMALRAARNVGCDVPSEAIDNAVAYVKRSWNASSKGFTYTPYGGFTIPCTGTGVLALEICARPSKDRKAEEHDPMAVAAVQTIVRNPPSWGSGHFFYAIYYCSQACFQVGGNQWELFKSRMHSTLLERQTSTGAWPYGDGYGNNYATAMAILAMTVEYRFLPIYQRGQEPIRKK